MIKGFRLVCDFLCFVNLYFLRGKLIVLGVDLKDLYFFFMFFGVIVVYLNMI